MHSAIVKPGSPESPRYWSDMRISCACGWKTNNRSYPRQVADYQQHISEAEEN